MKRQEKFNNIANAINTTVGYNSNHTFTIVLIAKNFYTPDHVVTVGTAPTMKVANEICRDFKGTFTQDFQENKFMITYLYSPTARTRSSLVSNQAYDPNKRY